MTQSAPVASLNFKSKLYCFIFFTDASDKPSKGNLRASTPAKGKAGRGKSSKDDKKGKEKDKHEESMDDEEDIALVPPLTVQVHIKLHYWKSAREAAQEFLPQGVPSLTGQN